MRMKISHDKGTGQLTRSPPGMRALPHPSIPSPLHMKVTVKRNRALVHLHERPGARGLCSTMNRKFPKNVLAGRLMCVRVKSSQASRWNFMHLQIDQVDSVSVVASRPDVTEQTS